MGLPLIQTFRVARYVLGRKLRGIDQYPLVLMLEPLFRCNLSCAGCGKINVSDDVLERTLTVEECLSAVDECGAPIVSIAGGEPLLHKDLPRIVTGIVRRKKFVYLCTNGLLLRSRIHEYTPSAYLTISIHLDGTREYHDALAGRPGVYDQAVAAIQLARAAGFRVTVNSTLYEGMTAREAADLFDLVMDLGVEGVTIAPGYSYTGAAQQDVFLQSAKSSRLIREIFRLGKGRRWKFNQSALFLDFLAGNQSYQCTPWGNPTLNVLGWQKPCYLLSGEGYARSFKGLLTETDWASYGRGRHPKCSNCMMHSGFEATAVLDTLSHPLKALRVYLRGPFTDGCEPHNCAGVKPDSTESKSHA